MAAGRGEAAARALQLQLGGAVGTLAVMGEKGAPVARHMADSLRLALPPGAWQTQRDDWVALGCEVGAIANSLLFEADGEPRLLHTVPGRGYRLGETP